jgi:hypothetical protein
MRAAVLLLLGACASAGHDVSIDSNGGTTDSPNQQHVDAKLLDAPPGAQTKELFQTSSQTLQGGTSVACPNGTLGGTSANNYYRVFDLASFGITSSFIVSKVTFQVEDSQSVGNNGSSVAVRVGTYAGTPADQLDNAMMTILASNPTVAVPQVVESGTTTPGATVNAPISATIPANSKLLVEIDSPDGGGNYELYIGANNQSETAPAYVLAPSCNYMSQPITKPTNINKLATSMAVHLLISVTGQYQP